MIDATQLKRQLYLTTQLLELGLPMIVVLNKSDRKEAAKIFLQKMSAQLACPVVTENSVGKHAGKKITVALKNISSSSVAGHLLTLPEALADYSGMPLELERQACGN